MVFVQRNIVTAWVPAPIYQRYLYKISRARGGTKQAKSKPIMDSSPTQICIAIPEKFNNYQHCKYCGILCDLVVSHIERRLGSHKTYVEIMTPCEIWKKACQILYNRIVLQMAYLC